MPLSSAIVLNKKNGKLFVPLYFENGLTTFAPVESRAYVSAIAQNGLGRTKQQAAADIYKIHAPLISQFQIAKGQSKKPAETVTLDFDIGKYTLQNT